MNVIQPTLAEMVRRSAAAIGLSREHLTSGKRSTGQISQRRWAIMLALHEKRQMSLSEIGNALGGFDHSSVSYGLGRARELRQVDKKFYEIQRRAAQPIRRRDMDFYYNQGFTRQPVFPGGEDCGAQI